MLIHFGRYGLVGLLRPLTVYPSEMVYWGVSSLNDLNIKVNNIISLIESTDYYDFPRCLPF